MKRIRPILGVLVLFSSIALGQNAATSQHGQLSFEIGHRRPVVKHPVSPSDAELAAIRQVTPVEQKIAGLTPDKLAAALSIPKPTREGLEAALLPLSGSAERDLIVIGSGRRYVRGDLAPFWIIREEHGKPKVVLSIFTHGLEIRPFTHHGLADLEVWRGTGMGELQTLLFFDGNHYFEIGDNMD